MQEALFILKIIELNLSNLYFKIFIIAHSYKTPYHKSSHIYKLPPMATYTHSSNIML